MGKAIDRAQRPCFSALRRERLLPSGVRGPVLRAALRRLIAARSGASVVVVMVVSNRGAGWRRKRWKAWVGEDLTAGTTAVPGDLLGGIMGRRGPAGALTRHFFGRRAFFLVREAEPSVVRGLLR